MRVGADQVMPSVERDMTSTSRPQGWLQSGQTTYSVPARSISAVGSGGALSPAVPVNRVGAIVTGTSNESPPFEDRSAATRSSS
jgi:hypothetical protein